MGCKKVKKKKKKKKRKILYGTFSIAILLFPIIKRAEKVSGFVYFRKGRGKMINKLIKKKKKIFLPLERFFDNFWSLVCRKRCLGSFSGVRRRSREEKKKVILRKRC